MKIIEGEEYYSVNDVAKMVGRSRQTIRLWDNWSEEREKEAYNELISSGFTAEAAKRLARKSRFIPEPKRVGPKGTRFWSKSDVEEIKRFVSSIYYGKLAEFSRTRWGRRGRKID